MTDRGTATFVPSSAFIVITDFEPVLGGSGGTPVDPKRFLNVGGTATPIQ